MKKNLKRSGDEAGLAPTNEEPAKSPRFSGLDSMPVIPSEFAEVIVGILQEKDVASRIFTIIRSSGDQCKLKVKGAVLNVMCRISISWAEAHQMSCIMGHPELESKPWLQSIGGQLFWHDNCRGYEMNYEIRKMMEQLTHQCIDDHQAQRGFLSVL